MKTAMKNDLSSAEYSMRITMNNFVEINLNNDMFHPTLLERDNDSLTFRVDREKAPSALMESAECPVVLKGPESCNGVITGCSCDSEYLYLKCRLNKEKGGSR